MMLVLLLRSIRNLETIQSGGHVHQDIGGALRYVGGETRFSVGLFANAQPIVSYYLRNTQKLTGLSFFGRLGEDSGFVDEHRADLGGISLGWAAATRVSADVSAERLLRLAPRAVPFRVFACDCEDHNKYSIDRMSEKLGIEIMEKREFVGSIVYTMEYRR